jgi:hypothetical protein
MVILLPIKCRFCKQLFYSGLGEDLGLAVFEIDTGGVQFWPMFVNFRLPKFVT